MKVTDYQKAANRTSINEPDFEITNDQVMISWNAIGLSGEAGEVAELAKKQIYHQHGIDTEKWKKELGDVLWYVAALCANLGLTMEEVMEHNINKLEARFPNGYDRKRTTSDYKKGIAK